MPSEKRQRQDEGRLQRLEEQRVAAKQTQRKRQGLTLVLILVALLVVAGLISILSGDDEDDVSTEGTDTTEEATDEATDDTSGEAASVYGTTPCPVEGTESAPPFDSPFEQCIDPAKAYTATFETSAGTVVVDLDAAAVPGTVNNFVSLVRSGYYDGTELFRTDPSIGIIQGGAPSNDASDPGPGYTIQDEGGPFAYAPGQLVMARSQGEDSAGAQFFFSVTDDVSALDAQGTYVVFGAVTEGLDVLEAILASHVAEPDNPLGGSPEPAVTIDAITITEA
jgi:peptidyl-prolyl cis-trans isomerase B (cyclophilin B)